MTYDYEPTFEKTEKYRQLEAKVWPLFATADKGTTIDHEAIEKASGLVRHTVEWQNLINGIKKRCEKERSMWLRVDREIGYRLLTDAEAVTQVKDEAGHSRRRCRKTNRKSKCIDESKLSFNQREVLDFYRKKLSEASKVIGDITYSSRVQKV